MNPHPATRVAVLSDRVVERSAAAVRCYTAYLGVTTGERYEILDLTPALERVVAASGVDDGTVLVSAMHITSSVYVNDREPGLWSDTMTWLEGLAPARPEYLHHRTGEDNADAHLKRMLLGHQVVVPITAGALDVGPWERVHYGEFDGRRLKRVVCKVQGIPRDA